jgi:hypothetical protein
MFEKRHGEMDSSLPKFVNSVAIFLTEIIMIFYFISRAL